MTSHAVSAYTVYPTGFNEATFTDKHTWTITVTDGMRHGWAVRWMGECLNSDGEWEYEPIPSSREDDFFARCRFPEQEAIERAKAVVDSLVINGRTFIEADIWVKARGATGPPGCATGGDACAASTSGHPGAGVTTCADGSTDRCRQQPTKEAAMHVCKPPGGQSPGTVWTCTRCRSEFTRWPVRPPELGYVLCLWLRTAEPGHNTAGLAARTRARIQRLRERQP